MIGCRPGLRLPSGPSPPPPPFGKIISAILGYLLSHLAHLAHGVEQLQRRVDRHVLLDGSALLLALLITSVLLVLLLRLLRLLILVRLLGLLILVALLTLLWGLLLRRLVIRIWLPGTLGVAGRGAVIRHLSAVGGLIPALLRLLCALLAWNLLSARRSRIVDGDSRVLVQGWLIYAPLVVGHLWRQAGGAGTGSRSSRRDRWDRP